MTKIIQKIKNLWNKIINWIVEQYNKPKDAQKQGQLLNYFITNKLKNLMEHIGDFTK